ncbi:MAG: TetR/AcrR family transcriptional regulator [Paracoccaceae bacterium]|jgi:AcrR family transcriptional regulator|nr:TetR/AcrR family transcriptional regulator [Paracoccaceae bacterium]
MAQATDTPQIRKGRKYDQVLDGARTIFLRDGFEGASVDDIAREAGVSKATLYSYFPDKRLLFMEVAKSECARQADEAVELIHRPAPPEQVLRFAAERIVAFMASDFGQGIFRICVAEADRFPQLGHEFYHSGPLLVRTRLVEYLREATARGDFVIEDFDLAADQFAELCKADIHARLIFGVDACCAPRDVKRTIDGAVEMFMARYGAKPA